MLPSNPRSVEVRMYPDGRMDTTNAAAYTGLSQKTLAMKRSNGTGPKFVKRGRIFYYKRDLDEWLEAGLAKSTAQACSRARASSVSTVTEDADRPWRSRRIENAC